MYAQYGPYGPPLAPVRATQRKVQPAQKPVEEPKPEPVVEKQSSWRDNQGDQWVHPEWQWGNKRQAPKETVVTPIRSWIQPWNAEPKVTKVDIPQEEQKPAEKKEEPEITDKDIKAFEALTDDQQEKIIEAALEEAFKDEPKKEEEKPVKKEEPKVEPTPVPAPAPKVVAAPKDKYETLDLVGDNKFDGGILYPDFDSHSYNEPSPQWN